MDVKKLSYFSDFAACPIAALGVLFVTLHASAPIHLPVFVAASLAGLIAWTLVEYLMHRFVYHRAPIIRDMHEVHHHQPLSYEGTPPLLSAILIGLFIYAPLLPFGSNVAGGAAVGMLIGYVTYMGVHHALHHLSPLPGSFLYALWKGHARHHYARKEGNYGVTSDIWDRVFRTTLDQHVPGSEA
ncbi:MAG: sterol desaturase family protein [Hyphomicrobiales bacterium]|nr:sterol desaturase family protein [Hyphomicrobiales bacterium]